MHRLSELVGKPVVSADSGEKLGSVSDVLVDDGRLQVVGLVLGGGMLGKDQVVPFHDVQTLGGDVIVLRTAGGVLAAREWRESGTAAMRASTLGGKPVVSASGQRMGTVSDLVVTDTGAFDALEVGTSAMGGLRTKRSLVRPSPQMKIGPDVIVVPDQAGEPAADWNVGPEHEEPRT